MVRIKPYIPAVIPFSTLSAPRDAPIVRSSIITIGAIKAPERSNTAKFCASAWLMLPETWNLLEKRA